MRVFKTNSHICKKTDDYGKQLLNYSIKREPITVNNDMTNTEKLFMFDSELYPFYDSKLNLNRMTKSTIEGKLISNFVTDEVLSYIPYLNSTFVLHNFEINEAGVGGHHQIKSTATMLMLLLKIAHFTVLDVPNHCLSMDIKYNSDNTIDIANSKLQLWSMIFQSDNQYTAKLINNDYKFKSNIVLDFMSVELPTFHSAVNTEIMSRYFSEIQSTIKDRLLNYPCCNFNSIDLDSELIPLFKDSKQCYNKFGFINNTWDKYEEVSSDNFFEYVQKILDYNDVHFDVPSKNIEYTNEIMKQIEIKTFSPYGIIDLIKGYQQRDKYVLSYSAKLFNLLNGVYSSNSFNVTPDFIRLTELEYTIDELTPFYKYYAYQDNISYVSYSELKRKKYHRHELENIIMTCIDLGIEIPYECFIKYHKRNNSVKENENYIELTFENLIKMISIKLKPENNNYKLSNKVSMIDFRIYDKLYK